MSADSLQFRLVADGHRYEALLDGERVGYADVDPIAADGLLIKHTEVSTEFEGRGFGAALVQHMLLDARRSGRSVIPICPYAAAYIKRHPEYLEYVRENYRAALARAHP
jgi:predicted GNAT family acetyltransferase